MAQIFNVACPSCRGSFPVHPELWQSPMDLLCPFCGTWFQQETSPLVVTGSGERRPGTAYVAKPAPRAADAGGGADSM